MARTSIQYQLHEKGGEFTATPIGYPTPADGEVCIRTKAIALNPIDWKRHLTGILVAEWPVVLGMDAAGIVEAVGQGVEDLHIGDEVFCLVGRSNRAAAFQEVIASPAMTVARKPDFLSFEEAASIPLCFVTAAAYIVFGLHLSLSFVKAPEAVETLESVLVLGGSSAVGGAAIQLLRMALPDAIILTTSSAQHHSRLTALGASKCFDRSVSVGDLKDAAGGQGVDGILDAVGGAADQPAVFEALKHDGPRLYSQVLTGKSVQVPSDVKSKAEIAARELFTLSGGMTVVKTLGEMLQSKEYQPPVRVEVVGKGLGSIATGLEVLKKGVSGTKCVISVP